MKTLYVIGNGFDLHHQLDTWYSSFGLFIRDNHRNIYDYFLRYFGFPELDENDPASLRHPLWSSFEASLATLDIDEVLEQHLEFAARPGNPDFRAGNWDDIAVYVSEIRDDLTVRLLELFKEFIRNVRYPPQAKLLRLTNEAVFFSFNYTKTLEEYYGVHRDRILYIHNRADGADPLVLGHGLDPTRFARQPIVRPPGMNDEEYEEWRFQMANNYDVSIERGRDELIEYFRRSFKATAQLIAANDAFFQQLNAIKTVYVLGHSLADVDKSYIEKIRDSVDRKAIWVVSYHNANEKKNRIAKMVELGVSKSRVIAVVMKDLEGDRWKRIWLWVKIVCARGISIIS